MKNDDRLIGIDLIKTFAVACVVMIHVSAGFASDAGMIGTAQHALSVVWRCLCGAAVPLFFMCSGALMLRAEKELSIKNCICAMCCGLSSLCSSGRRFTGCGTCSCRAK